MKLLPFYNVKNYELEEEMSFCTLSKGCDKTRLTPSLSTSPSQILASNLESKENTGDSLNDCVDSFSHVYCDYVSQNDVSGIMSTGNPHALSVFHGNIDGLNSKLSDITEVFS